VVRLNRALGDERVGVVAERRAQQVFELAGLVAAAGETRAVVALDPEGGSGTVVPGQQGGQPRQGFQ
jgi:hypothetical protein